MGRFLRLALVLGALVIALSATTASAQEYPPDTGGTVVTRADDPGVEVAGSSATRLPNTGTDASTYVLIGVAAVSLGLLIVVGTRRRADVLGRT